MSYFGDLSMTGTVFSTGISTPINAGFEKFSLEKMKKEYGTLQHFDSQLFFPKALKITLLQAGLLAYSISGGLPVAY